jgi:hypothetical protein
MNNYDESGKYRIKQVSVLTKSQLQQVLIHLLTTDDKFLGSLHQAYLEMTLSQLSNNSRSSKSSSSSKHKTSKKSKLTPASLIATTLASSSTTAQTKPPTAAAQTTTAPNPIKYWLSN